MKKLFELAEGKGYKVHNKRVLSNYPEYTSEEGRKKDGVQEMTLLQLWLRESHEVDMWIQIDDGDGEFHPMGYYHFGHIIHKYDHTDTPYGTDYEQTWERCLESALKMIR